ncbi:MAG: TonB-dependent receptor [Pseudomonadota bacterium]
MVHTTTNKLLHSTALIGATTAVATAASAETAAMIDVPQQELIAAIEELSKETGKSIAVNRDAIGQRTSQAVQGPITVRHALELMVDDPDLSIVELSDGSLVVAAKNFVSQNLDDQPFDLGTIVITGERVERALFDTASSVQAYDGETIENTPEYNDAESVFENAANITTGTGNTAPHIRGVNSAGEISGGALGTVAGTLPRASFTVDGINLTPNQTIYGTTSVFDTEVIEVFRGPQTTSQGANAIAGAINIRTRDPVFEQQAVGRAELATDNGRAASVMLNTPLSDSVAVRFVYDFEEQDVFFDYIPESQAIQEAREIHQATTRLKILFEPVDLPQLRTQLTLSYNEFSAPQNQSVRFPLGDLVSDAIFPPVFSGDTKALVHDFEYDLGGGFTLRNQFQISESNSVRTNGTILFPDFPQRFLDRSNELLLDYAPEGGALSGLIGWYIRDTDETSPGNDQFDIEGKRSGNGIFAEFTQRFGNGFDVTAGLRYQENEQQRVVGVAGFPISLIDSDLKFDAWLPSTTIGYEPNANTRYAFRYSRGYNPGGSALILTTIEPYEFDEEYVNNFELSVRHRSNDGRLFLAANVFYSDYSDYQLFVSRIVPPAPPFGITQAGRLFNVADVRTYGMEASAQYSVSDALIFTGALGLLQTDVGDLGPDVAAFTGGTDNSGNALPLAPNITLNIGVEYDATSRLTLGGQINYTSSYYSDIDNSEEFKIDPFATVDISAIYELTPNAELYSYITNLFDTRSEVSLFEAGGSVTPPREIGFGVRASF